MDKTSSPVASFNIDHDRLLPGLYVSRRDKRGNSAVTTFDIRMKRPNAEPPIGAAAIHTLEHMLAVYLRGHSGAFAEKVLYIGPMGCRTGMYLLVWGDAEPADVSGVLTDAFAFAAKFEGDVPASASAECGSCREHDLEGGKREAAEYLKNILSHLTAGNTAYPE